MAERAIAPSERRRAEARQRGAVAFSPALSASAGFLAAMVTLFSTAPLGMRRLLELSRHAFAGGDPSALLEEAQAVFAWSVGPAAAAALGGALVAGLLQTGGLLKARAPDSERPETPRTGLLSSIALATIAATALVLLSARELPSLRAIVARPIGRMQPTGGALLAALVLFGRVGLRLGAVLLAAGVGDFALRYLRRERALRTTPAEARAEQREDQGDPHVRAEQRRRLRADRPPP